MSKPRRVATGPASSEVRSAARRAIVQPSLGQRLLPSPAALATTATACTVALATAAALTVPAVAAAPAPVALEPTVAAEVTREATAFSAAQGRRYVLDAVAEEAIARSAAEKAAAAKAAADQAAADKQAAAKSAADKAAADQAAAKAAAEKAAADKAAADKAAAAKAAAAKVAAQTVKAKAIVSAAPTGNFSPASRYGLVGGAVKTYNTVMSTFSGINSVGGYRASSLSNHQDGLAIDFMITQGAESALGWSIAKFLASNARALNINHIIFEQHIWTPSNPTWRLMEDRGGATANHMDHVHVSMNS